MAQKRTEFMTAGKDRQLFELLNPTPMKTTLPNGKVYQIYEDSDLDDEILPAKRGKLIIPHVIVAFGIGILLVLGIISIFCI